MLGVDCCCWGWCLLAISLLVLYKWLDNVIRRPRIEAIPSRHIFITGCDSGFGHIAAKRFDGMGCHVFAGCLTEKGEEELRKACSSRLHTVRLDVTRHDSVVNAAQYVKQHLPTNTDLWGIVNNAGIGQTMAPAEWLPLETYVNVFNVNCLGCVDVVKTFLPLLGRSGGRIVNVTSANGRNAMCMMSAYAISKFGVEAFSDSIRREMLKFGVTVHIIEPGAHKTPIFDAKRMTDQVTELWHKQPPQVQAKWEEYYKKSAEALPRIYFAPSAEPVVDAFEHALFSQRPRTRYLVGWDAKLVFVGLSMLPEYIGDRLLLFLFK